MDTVAGSGACGEGVLDPLDCADEVFGDVHFSSVAAETLSQWGRAQARIFSLRRVGPVIR